MNKTSNIYFTPSVEYTLLLLLLLYFASEDPKPEKYPFRSRRSIISGHRNSPLHSRFMEKAAGEIWMIFLSLAFLSLIAIPTTDCPSVNYMSVICHHQSISLQM